MNTDALPFEYKIIRSKRRKKSTSIHISPNEGVTIRVPHKLSEEKVDQIIYDRRDWITKKLTALSNKPQPIKKKFIDGEEFLYFGTPYPLNIHHAEIDTPQVELKWNIFLAKTPIANDQQLIANGLRQAFTRWYTKTGTEAISYRAEYFAHLIGVTFNKLRLKEVKTLWGSCSPKNNLTFNWKLVMAPAEVIDYVVVHELCHLRERNHSKRFWTLVKEFAPDYKVHRKWLKENAWQLSI